MTGTIISPRGKKRRRDGNLLKWGGVGAIWLGAGVMIGWASPDAWWKEVLMLVLIWLGLVSVGGGMWGKKKMGVLVGTGVVGLLLLRRWGIWDWTMVVMWLLVLGLISLVN